MIDSLYSEADREGIEVREYRFKTPRLKGLYHDGVITLNRSAIRNIVDKTCVLAEEIGHHHTTSGNILDQADLRNRKQELRARGWAYKRLIPLSRIVAAGQAGIEGRHDVAEFLGVTEEFLQFTIEYCQRKYGLFATYEGYLVYFEPLSITKI